MMRPRNIGGWIRRQVRGLGSLAAACVVVLGVLIYAMFSLSTPHDGPQRVAEKPAVVTRSVKRVAMSTRETLPSLYIKALADHPIALTAEIEVHGWKNRGQRIVDTNISRIEPASITREMRPSAQAYPEGEIRQQLSGQRVLASVSAEAVEQMPESGHAKVALVVTPAGDTATLVIDRVIEGKGVGVTAAAAVAAVGAPVPAPALTQGALVKAAASAPIVSALSRYWGPPGTTVTMSGSGFGKTMGKSWVTCNGAKASIRSWSNTRIVFRVPTKMTKQGYIGVVRSGRTSNGLYYAPFARPVITSITPREGAPGTVVTLKGSGFGTRQTDGWVSFTGSSAQIVSWTNTSIKVFVPRDATSGYVGVVAHGMASNGLLFAPLGAPLVLAVSTPVLLPDRSVTLTGRGFGLHAGSVLLGGKHYAADSWSPTEVRFTVPRGIGSGYVGVQRTSTDLLTSNGVWVPWAPRVASLSKWWAPPQGELTLSGVDFGKAQGDRVVRVAGVQAAVKSWSDQEIIVEVPADARTGYVGIGSPSASSNGIHLVVEKPAHLDSVSSRNVAADDVLTIRGTDFGVERPTSRVSIGLGLGCTVLSWSDTEIVVRAPLLLETSYVGVIKNGVSSNGVWVTPRASD